MEYKDGAVEKSTLVTQTDDEGKTSQVEKVEKYTEADIANGIATCDRLLATGGLDEGNIKAVQAEKDWWLGCQKLIPVVEGEDDLQADID